MRPRPDPELVDDENPEWLDEDIERAVPFSELPPDLQETLASRPHRLLVEIQPGSGLVPVPLKEEVVKQFLLSGPGWEERINQILSDWLAVNSKDRVSR